MSRRGLHRFTTGMLAASLGLSVTGVLHAASVEEDRQDRTDLLLEAIQDELRLVRDENHQMKEEIDILRAESSDDWMTEQRAEQIKGLVADVLADADTRSSLTGNGLMAGWSDGFFLSSADGRFLLKIGALSQNRFMLNHRLYNQDAGPNQLPKETPFNRVDGWVYGFESTTTRLNFAGHLFGKDLTYRFELGYGRLDPQHYSGDDSAFGARLYEAWVRQRLTDELAVKVGLFRAPFSRETLVYAGRQLMINRSSVDMRLGMGRVQGIEVDYVNDQFRAMFSANSGSGALFTALSRAEREPPHAYSSDSIDYSFQLRSEFLLAGQWEQFKQFTSPVDQEFGLMIGVAGTAIHGEDLTVSSLAEDGPDIVSVYGGTADISAMFGGANLFASFYYEKQHDPAPTIVAVDWMAVVVQGGVYVDAKTELVARYQWGGAHHVQTTFNRFQNRQNQDPFGSTYQIVQVGFNYYIDGQDAKFSMDFGVSINPLNGVSAMNQTGWLVGNDKFKGQFLMRAQLQLMF